FSVRPLVTGALKEGLVGSGYSERVASEIDAEVQEVLAEADARAKDILVANQGVLDAIADALMEAETLEGDRLDALLLGVTRVTPASVG
nr:cell division protein FtsH [Actinomycetota bacterium]